MPPSAITALPLLASERTVSVALRLPAAVGAKLSVSVQVAPTASGAVVLQLPVRA
jgi:hypothetical protein